MRGRATLVIAVSWAATGLAQAPVEDRRPPSDSYSEVQQRVEFARRVWQQSERRAQEAEQNLKAAEAELEASQKQYDAAKSRADKAGKDLAQARAAVAESRKSYETESAKFGRLRGGAVRGAK